MTDEAGPALGLTPALSLTDVTKRYGTVRALEGLSFDVAPGRFFVLFGPSSVGKTTTLRAISGLVTPDSGRIAIEGRDVTQAPIRGRGVAMVFQSFALYPHLTVAENFAYPLREAGVGRSESDQRVAETAEMLSLTHRLGSKPGTLSGGEQQRVALGRALVRRPGILLLDEPLTNLDAKLRHDMRAELKRLHRQFGITVVYATPDELEALTMGEEIAVMEEGRVVQMGSPDELYERPRSLYVAAKIGSPHMNLFETAVGGDGRSIESPLAGLSLTRSGLSPGEAVVMGIRPSDIRLAKGEGPRLDAKVKLIEPLGDLTVVSLATAGPTLRVLLSEAEAVGVRNGDALPIAISPERVHVFRAKDGAAVVQAA